MENVILQRFFGLATMTDDPKMQPVLPQASNMEKKAN